MLTTCFLRSSFISSTGNWTRKLRRVVSMFLCIGNVIAVAYPWPPQDQTRGLHVKKIEENRPAANAPADPKQPRTYRSATSNVSSSDAHKGGAGEAVIGVTPSRLRQARSTARKRARIIDTTA